MPGPTKLRDEWRRSPAVNASALVAAIGDVSAFVRARDLAAWLGLVPTQATTGRKPKLLGITKRSQPLLAQEPDPRCAGGTAEARRDGHAVRVLAASAAS